MILERIYSPKNLKKLSVNELKVLCEELRSEIIRLATKNGGHLGSSLGSVELIVAAHFVFNCPNDKFVFDVGHQAYSHKLLTGRRDIMENLRQERGASGFTLPSESPFDSFISGHASNSLSASLGIAAARDFSHKDFNVVTFLGDGALTGGMIYEAFNNISSQQNFIVILNDNQMSISKSVGSINRYLTKLLSSSKALRFRKAIGRILDIMPNRLAMIAEKFIKNSIGAISGGTLFEEFGFQYIGPIDGHDLEALIKIFSNLQKVGCHKPVLVHTVTCKGKGYKPAESDLNRLHGVESKSGVKFTDVFSDGICEVASKNNKVICITPAMKSGSGLSKFSELFPNRFFDVGICEEHAVTFAAGLAIQGYKPFLCMYSTFMQRGFDQIYHDIVLQNLNVTFIIDKAGLPGNDGQTHSGLYDSSLLSLFQNFPIMAPSCGQDLKDMLWFAGRYSLGPMAIRFPKAEALELAFHDNELRIGKGRLIHSGKDDLIVSFGAILKNVLEAIEIVKKRNKNYNPSIIDAVFSNPFDFDLFFAEALKHKKIILFEESVDNFIYSTIVKKILIKKPNILKNIIILTANKDYIHHTSRDRQLELFGLSPEKIALKLENLRNLPF